MEANIFQRLALVLLCIYLVANLANDFTMRFFGSRAYLSLVSGALLPVVCLASGSAFAGLKVPAGRWWTAFMIWMLLCIPMSYWPGGSATAAREFVTKNFVLFFYIPAAIVSIHQLRTLFRVMTFGGFAVILACIFFGGTLQGRFMIPKSIFFDNSNDLAMQLLISSGFFFYFIISKGFAGKLAGGALLLAALFYMLQTGSRSNFLALLVCLFAVFFMTRKKIQLAATVLVVSALAAFTVSSGQLSRLILVGWGDSDPVRNTPSAQNTQEVQAAESQAIRGMLIRQSVEKTITHPIFGLGPDQFSEALWAEAKNKGVHITELRTHNAYTQVSSEMGIPGFIFYLATELSVLILAFRVFVKARRIPELVEIRNMASALFLLLLAYSVASLFHHVAYSRHLPILAGMTVTLAVLAGREFARFISNLPQNTSAFHPR